MARNTEKRRKFKADAFVTVGSENPHAEKFAKTGKARHRPPENAMEAQMRKYLLGFMSKGPAARIAANMTTKPEHRAVGTKPPTSTPSAEMMIKKKKRK